MDPLYIKSLAVRGVDGTLFRSRRLSQQMIESASLVLTAERRHRDAVVSLLPRAHRRTFTLAQASRLINTLDEPPSGVVALVHALASTRGRVPAQGERDDIPDPYGGSIELHEEVEAAVLSSLETLAPALGFAVDASAANDLLRRPECRRRGDS